MSDYNLPEKFGEYQEGRKKSFLRVKEIKDNGGKVAGTFCAFTPSELLYAAGVYPVSLCGTSNETVQYAERDLPKNLCPLIKSSYGFAVSEKCPYTYFADIIVGETTCDGKKKMYEILSELKEMYVLQVPQGELRPYSKKLWVSEIRRFKEYLERRFNVEITDEKLRAAAYTANRLRAAKCGLMELQKLTPPPMYGRDMYKFMDGGGFNFDREKTIKDTLTLTEETRRAYDAGNRPVPAESKRLLITGCPIGGVLEKVVGTAEENGGVVVCFENCGGIKPARIRTDTEAEDILEAIALPYMDIGCSVMSPNQKRMEMLTGLFDEFRVDGVIDVTLQTCHPYTIETRAVRKLCQEHGMPYMALETDYSTADSGQLCTRIAAFIETIA